MCDIYRSEEWTFLASGQLFLDEVQPQKCHCVVFSFHSCEYRCMCMHSVHKWDTCVMQPKKSSVTSADASDHSICSKAAVGN